MSDIITLWESGHLPIHDALYFPDGTVLNISMQSYPSPRIIRGEALTSSVSDMDLSYVTSIGETIRLTLCEFGFVSLGEGSYGSEGFFAHLNSKSELQWVFYSERCNPFVSVEAKENGSVLIESSAGFWVFVDLFKPQNMYLL